MRISNVILACDHAADYHVRPHWHAAIESTLGSFRNAALFEANRILGLLPDWVIAELGVDTQVRQVSMSAERERHAVKRRQSAGQRDVDLVALRAAEALNNIHTVKHRRDALRWRLICGVPSENRGLGLALKFVPKVQARTHRDEFWIETLIPQST